MPRDRGSPTAPSHDPVNGQQEFVNSHAAHSQNNNQQFNHHEANGHRTDAAHVTTQQVATAPVDDEGNPLAPLEIDDDLLPQALHAQLALSRARQTAAELAAHGLEAENGILRRALAEAEADAAPVRARARALQRVSHRQQRLIDLQWLMLDRRGVEVPHSVLGEGQARTAAAAAANGTNTNGTGDTEGGTPTHSDANSNAANNAESQAIDAMTLLSRAERSLASASDSLSALGVLLQAGNTTVGHADIMAIKGQIDGLHRTWAPLPAFHYAHASLRGNAAGQRLVDGLGGIEAYWTKD